MLWRLGDVFSPDSVEINRGGRRPDQFGTERWASTKVAIEGTPIGRGIQ
jgi:hypothetical protein